MKKLLFLALLSVLFVACDDESGLSGGGRMQVAWTVTPAFSTNEGAYVSTSAGMLSLMGGVSYLITDEISVTKGQNFPVTIQAYSYAPCHNYKVEFILNGNVVRTDNYSMGYSSAPGVAPLTTCPDGAQKTLNYIVP